MIGVKNNKKEVISMFIEETLGSIIDQKCLQFANDKAMIFPSANTTYTYRQFQELYTSLAKGLLAIGVKKNDHIAILSLNSPLWIALQIAAAKIGAVAVCLNTSYKKKEIEFVLGHSQSSVLLLLDSYKGNDYFETLKLICPELSHSTPGKLNSQNLPLLKKVIMLDNTEHEGTLTLNKLIRLGRRIDDSELLITASLVTSQDIANICYTSGTTGNPKAVMSTHFSIVNNALISGMRMQYEKGDRLMLSLPLFHVIGLVLSAIAGLFYDTTLVILERFETEKALYYLDAENCTIFNGVPTMFNFMLNSANLADYNLSLLKKGFVAGSCCGSDLILRIINELGITTIANLYGQTEAMGITQISAADSLEHRISSIGKPLLGVETKIIDPVSGMKLPYGCKGELCVKTAYLMKGYYKNEEATNKAVDKRGWLHTGDLASCDKEGYITIEGRIKDIIIRGGENISPTEIENVIINMDGVRDVAVVSVPDKVLGEEICACIIKEADLSTEDIISYATKNMAKYKVPKHILFIDKFPLTSSGKVKKAILREFAKSEIVNLISKDMVRTLSFS